MQHYRSGGKNCNDINLYICIYTWAVLGACESKRNKHQHYSPKASTKDKQVSSSHLNTCSRNGVPVPHGAFSWHPCFDGLFLTTTSRHCGASLLQCFIKPSPVAGLILDHGTKQWCVSLLFRWGSALKITLNWNSLRTVGNKPHEEPLKM